MRHRLTRTRTRTRTRAGLGPAVWRAALARAYRAPTRELVLGAALLVACAGLAAAAAVRNTPRSGGHPDLGREVLELLPQDVAVVEFRRLERRVPLTGTLEPRDRTEVRAQVASQVQEVRVRPGDAVARGQLLARLDARELEARVADKRAALSGAWAQYGLAEKKRASARKLHERELVAQADLDAAESGYLVSLGTTRSLKAQLEEASKAVEDCQVRSPLDGVVAERVAQPGAVVAPGSALFTVLDLSSLELTALVPAGEIPAVRLGQDVEFRVDGFTGRVFTGTVERINPATEAGSRSIAIHVRLANASGELRGGMFAHGSLLVSERQGAPVVPADAVREESGAAFVYRVASDVLERRSIEIDARDVATGTVALASGLDVGDRVVVGELAGLETGARVRIGMTP